MPTRCFLLTPTKYAGKTLRRFCWSGDDRPPCDTGRGYHDATSPVLGRTTRLRRHPADGWPYVGWDLKPLPHSDPRWPTHCDCGYAFRPDDQWQHHANLLWRRSDTLDDPADLVTLRGAPVGACYDAWWQPADWRGPDGVALNVRLPCGHDWPVDGPATSGGRWSRTGTPPEVSVTPSIVCGTAGEPGYFHGFLGSNGQPPGVLSDHIG